MYQSLFHARRLLFSHGIHARTLVTLPIAFDPVVQEHSDPQPANQAA